MRVRKHRVGFDNQLEPFLVTALDVTSVLAVPHNNNIKGVGDLVWMMFE